MIEKMTKYGWIVPSSLRDEFWKKLRSLGVIDISRASKPIDQTSESFLLEIGRIKAEIACIRKVSDPAVEALAAEVTALAGEAENCRHWGEFDKVKMQGTGLEFGFHCVSLKKYDPSWKEKYALEEISREEGKVWFVIIGAPDFRTGRCEGPSRPYSEAAAALKEKEAELDLARKTLAERSSEIPALEARIEGLEADLNAYLAGLKTESAADGVLCIFEGFAPSSLDAALKKEFDDAEGIYWTSSPASPADRPPIKLRNNRFVKQFEVLTGMYGMPDYGEFDPTVFLSIFFLLFFAMCMGDMGYGAVLIVLGLCLKGKNGGLAKLWSLIVTLGVGTVLVGFCMGTVFGVEIPALSWLSGDISFGSFTCAKQMALALAIGVIHLSLALTVKTVWTIRRKIADKGSAPKKRKNIFLMLGGFLWGLYQFVSGLVGDILSYIRLYALGLSGYMLGSTFNKIAIMELGDSPTWQWIPFALTVLLGHTLNLAMSGLGAFVHPLRLNFVEFFKNSGYAGTGTEYKPIVNNNIKQ